MKKIVVFLLLLCLFISNFSIKTYASALDSPETSEPVEDTPVIISGTQGIDATSALLGTGKRINNVRAAVTFEANSKTMMYAYNADTQMHPASLVKIMTALIAIQSGQLDDLVIVSQKAISSVPYDAISADLKANEVLRMEDLIYCLMVGSASDAAAVIAEHISGSQDAFVQKMNDYANEIGCTGTHFTNAHGLHDSNQYTTARDCARILSVAMENEKFRKVFTANSYTVPATNVSAVRELTTGNAMKDASNRQYYDSRIIGGRTGTTNDGRRCLASAADHNGMLLICVVMGSESVYQEDGFSAVSIGGYQETTQLLDACIKGFKASQILYKDQAVRQIPIADGNCDVIVGPDVSLSTVLPHNASVSDLTFRYADKVFNAPITKGQAVSELQVWYGNVCVAQTELYALNNVRRISDDVQPVATEPEDDYSIILWIFIPLAVLAAAVVILNRYGGLKVLIAKIRKRNYKRSRRRSK